MGPAVQRHRRDAELLPDNGVRQQLIERLIFHVRLLGVLTSLANVAHQGPL